MAEVLSEKWDLVPSACDQIAKAGSWYGRGDY